MCTCLPPFSLSLSSFMVKPVHNITLLSNSYKEENTLILRVTEVDIEEAFTKMIWLKIILKREKENRKREIHPFKE